MSIAAIFLNSLSSFSLVFYISFSSLCYLSLYFFFITLFLLVQTILTTYYRHKSDTIYPQKFFVDKINILKVIKNIQNKSKWLKNMWSCGIMAWVLFGLDQTGFNCSSLQNILEMDGWDPFFKIIRFKIYDFIK